MFSIEYFCRYFSVSTLEFSVFYSSNKNFSHLNHIVWRLLEVCLKCNFENSWNTWEYWFIVLECQKVTCQEFGFFFSFPSCETGSHCCNPSWPRTLYVDQDSINLRDLSASVHRVLVLKVCTITLFFPHKYTQKH